MRPFSQLPNPRLRALGLFLAFGALVVLLLATVITSQAYVTKVTETTLDDFASGEFRRTGLLDIPAQAIDSIQLIPIGLVGTWYEDAQNLPIALTEHSVVAAGGHLIVMGGSDSSFQNHNEVYISKIGNGGALNPWVEQTSNLLPVALSGAAAVVYPVDDNTSWVYVIGGNDGTYALDSVYYTTFHHDTGTIDAWLTNTNPLSVPTYYLAATVHNGYVYVVGGYQEDPPFFGPTNKVYYAKIQANGSLGAWQAGPDLPGDRYNNFVVAYGGATDTLYVMGGRSSSIVGNYQVFFADINLSDGSLSAWQTSQGNLILPIYAHSGTLVADQIVVTGGRFRNAQGTSVITGTVQAALVDPNNAGYRLYDWCEGQGGCTIGAWLTGKQLPNIRAFHQTVQEDFYIYTLGGVYAMGQPTASVYRGSMTDKAVARYAPSGYYISSEFDFGQAADLRQIEWGATLAYPLSQTLQLSYQYKRQGQNWHAWSAPASSVSGTNQLPISPAITDVILFQYRITLTSDMSISSPLFNWIDIFYELDDADLAVSKNTGVVISAALGSDLDYTIVFTNNGQWQADNVIITETLPDHTSFGGDVDVAWQQIGASNRYTTNVGSLAPGIRDEVTFRVRIDSDVPLGVKRITNTVDIDYPTMYDELGEPSFDPNLSDNHAEFSNPLLLYNVDVGKAADPPSGSHVIPTQRVTYTITYSSAGDLDLTGVMITDIVPADTAYAPGSIWPPSGDDSNLPLLSWSIGDLAAGVSGTVGFAVTVSDAPSGTVFDNQAYISTDRLETEGSNQVAHAVQVPQLVLTKNSAPPPKSFVAPNQRIDYTITLTNNSRFTVPGMVVTDVTPLQTTYISGSIGGPGADDSDPSELKWLIGSLAPHQGVTLTFAATVRNLPANTIVANQAQGNSPPTHLQESNLVTHTIRPLDLFVWKEAMPSQGSDVAVGQQIDYSIHYLNNSGDPMTGVILTDSLPIAVTYVSGSISGPGADDSGAPELKWNVGAVLSGEGGSVGFSVVVNDVISGTLIENIAQGDSAESEPMTSLTVTHTVQDVVPGLTKAATPASGASVQAGDQINYTLSYLNDTSQTMSGFVLTDTLPGLVDYVPGSIWPSLGDDSDPQQLEWTIGDLGPGDSGTVGFAVRVRDTVGGGLDIVNTFEGSGLGLTPATSNKVTHTTQVVDGTDFTIVDIVLDPAEPEPGQSFDVQVTIKNEGNRNADDDEFWVEVYVKSMPASPPLGPADHYQGYCQDPACATLRAEYVEWRPDLDAGAEFPFQFDGLIMPRGRYMICAQVDICFVGYYCKDPEWGWYPEQDETNNIFCLAPAGPAMIYLPAVYKNY